MSTARRLRILVVEPAGELWGSERALLDVLGHLPDCEVAVCCPPDRPLLAELIRREIRVLPYFIHESHKKGRVSRLMAALGVLRACVSFRPDLIHLNQSGSYRTALPAAALFRLPIIAHVRIFEDAAYLASCKPHAKRLRALIAISQAMASELRERGISASIPTHVLYDAYVSAAQPVGPQRARRIACVGRVVPVKGLDVLVAAMGLLPDRGNPGPECIVVGDGPAGYVAELKRQSERGPKVDRIRWVGLRSDVMTLLKDCSVLACPSLREPLGRVILEAWEAGLVPVAYAGSGGAAEVIRRSEGGIVYSEQTAASLACALSRALSLSSDEAAALAANGRAWTRENCDPGAYGKSFRAIAAEAIT